MGRVIFVKSVVLLYRLDSAAPPNNCRGAARSTMTMRLEVLRRYLLAWQALIPCYHAPALYCRALPLLLQRARAATTVTRQARVGVNGELSTTRTASYSLVTARTVGVSDSESFQSTAIRGYRETRKTSKTLQEQNKMQNGETRMACET
eukprot:3190286-Pleurochrysis_carterae.AAC.1